jgi:adenylate kinase family enzyme
MSQTGRVVIVTGPPGSGKSTVAEVLAESAQRPTVHLLTDTFYRWIRAGYIAPYLKEAAQQNEVVIGVIADAAARYALGGYDVIIDGIVGPWFLDKLRGVLRRHRIATSYVVLRPRLDVALSRAAGRSGDELILPEPISHMHEQFGNLAELEGHVVDSSEQTAEQTVEQVRNGLSHNAYLLPG